MSVRSVNGLQRRESGRLKRALQAMFAPDRIQFGHLLEVADALVA